MQTLCWILLENFFTGKRSGRHLSNAARAAPSFSPLLQFQPHLLGHLSIFHKKAGAAWQSAPYFGTNREYGGRFTWQQSEAIEGASKPTDATTFLNETKGKNTAVH